MQSLKEKYAPYFKIGAAVNARTINTHKDLLTRHFNSVTCENEMKYEVICPSAEGYDYTGADAIYKFAQENKMDVRGHTLVWHNQTPDFIFDDPAKLRETLEQHMTRLSERYGDIYAWDVVNEAINDKEDLQLRQTKWLDAMGEDYIAEAFAMAARIFPGKKLYYNDYNECDSEKLPKIVKLLKSLIEHGVPIHGMGMQAHSNIVNGPPIDAFKRALESYAALGLEVSVTELDVSLFAHDDKTSLPAPPADRLEKQADYYGQLFATMREYHKHIDSVTLWGVADDATWLSEFPVQNRKNWPLLFDANHEPKEAFWRIVS